MAEFGLSHDAWGRLVLIDSAGRRHVDVRPLRLFPHSDPERWFALCDESGREIVLIEDPMILPHAQREMITQELKRREFLPIIRHVYRVSGISPPCEWDVETDRGRVTFVLKSDEDVRRLPGDQTLLIDGQGIRYLVPDRQALNAYGRKMLDWYL